MGGSCSAYGGGEAQQVLGGITEGKRPHGRSGHRWEDYIKMDLQEAG